MKIFKNKNILLHLFISYLLFISILIIFGGGLSRVASYAVAFMAATFSICFLSHKFKDIYHVNITSIAMIGFCIKLLIGYIFWDLYMWPNYFSNEYSQIVYDHFEYLFTHNSMEKIAEHRLSNSFFSLPPVDYALGQGKYIFINYIMSNLYLSGNSNLLDFSIQNSLFSFYTAVLISLMSIIFGATKKQAKIIFIIALFQPFSFISIMIWRDVVGQFFFMLGVYLLLISFNEKIIKASTIIVFSSISMALLRSIYIFIPFFLYSLKYLKDGMISLRKGLIFAVLIIFFLFILARTSLISFLESGYSSYLSGISSIQFIITLPIEYFRAILGPFPWINWFKFTDNTIFLLANYLQAVYVVSILYFAIKYYKSSQSEFKSYIAFLFFLLLTMSLAPTDIHTEYYTFAAVLLLPISAKYITIPRFMLSYILVFSIFLILNLIYFSIRL